MTEQMQSLCAKRDSLKNSANTIKAKDLTVAENLDALNKVLDEIEATDKAIDALEKAETIETQSATAVTANKEDSKKFKNLGEQLRAIKDAAMSKGRVVDPRLVKDEIKGVNTETDADGGYAIQSDFIGNILDRAFARSEIVRRCRQYGVSTNSNRANWVTPDDSEDAAKEGVVVAGGVQAYWASEGQTVPPSKPKFMPRELKLGKIMGIAYVTEEALQDIPFMAGYLEDSFSDAVDGLLTDGILNGKGEVVGEARQPEGVLASKAVVAVAKSGAEVTAKDLLAMKSRMRKKNWANAVWYMHPDLEEILPLLKDDAGNQLYFPAGGLSGVQYDTILGRPIVYDEFLPAKGSYGEVLLADFSNYLLIKKGEERKDWSMHVEFLTDQQCFRIIMRVNGAPMDNRTYAVRNSTKKRGAFVALGTPASGASVRSTAKSSITM